MTHAPLQRLSAALEEERRAIVEHDVEGLVRCTQEKLDALRALEAAAAGYGFPDELQGRLTELAEMNHANGILLARRRRPMRPWPLLPPRTCPPAPVPRTISRPSPTSRRWPN